MPKKVLKRNHGWRSASPSLNTLIPPSPGTTPVPTPRPSAEPFTLAEGYTAMVEQYLAGNLPPLVPADNHTPSNSTREQSYFDMHLHEDLRLKKIKFLDQLPQVLSKVVDKYLAEPPITHLKELRNIPKLVTSVKLNIVNEGTLTECYRELIINHTLLASQLCFGAGIAEPIFSLSKNDPNARRVNAIADCYFHLGPLDNVENVAESHKTDMNLIRKYELENLVIWEFESLVAGPDILDTLKSLEGDFNWLACYDSLTKDNQFASCRKQSHRTDGRLNVTGRRTGPDSEIVGDIIKQCLVIIRTIPEEDEEGEEEALNGKGRPEKRQKVEQDDDGSVDGHRVTVIVNTKLPGSEHEQFVADIGKLLQQMWTQIVSEDATFAIISCGTKEYLCIRCRQTQTLYLSPLLEPTKSSHDRPSIPHVKLLISLFLCAYEDALSRAKQLENYLNMNPRTTLLPLMELKFDEANRTATRTQKNVVKEDDRSKISPTVNVSEEHKTSKQVKVDNGHVLDALRRAITVSLQSRVKNFTPSATPLLTLTRVESDPSGDQGSPDSTDTIYLNIEKHITERVYTAYVGIRNPDSQETWYQKNIYVKISRNENDLVELTKEYEHYKRLNAVKASEVVEMFGFLGCKGVEIDGASWHFLLLADGGQTLGDRSKPNRDSHLQNHRELYVQALRSLNSRNVFHHNITSKHLVYDSQGKKAKAKLISLSQCDEDPSHGVSDLIMLDRHLAIKRS